MSTMLNHIYPSKAACFFSPARGFSGLSLLLRTVSFFVITSERRMSFVNAVIMIVRVWALYNRSKYILRALLLFYVAEVILVLVATLMLCTQSTPVGM